ncbi:MAG: hypothetical protein JO291_12915 [Acidimicrobiia bacterium]|nr:hypothetical protein [Acidimicrobiia bacterium]
MTPGSTAARYRCRTCGNLTRFDVTTNRRTRAFHHYTVGGELAVEDETVLDERVESVTCRWCGPSGVVEPVAEDEVAAVDGEGRS